MADGIDARVNRMEASRLDSPSDGARAEACPEELIAGDDAVLLRGKLGDQPFGRPSGAFSPVCGSDVTLGGHARQCGAPARAGGALNVAGVRRYARGPRRTGSVVSWFTNGFPAYRGWPASSISG